jgi:hypothetical protein
MRVSIPLLILAAVLSGCGSRGITLQAPFDNTQATRQLAAGANTVKGSALMRQRGGGVVTCAGLPVHLMPVTPRAREWATHLYGGSGGGFFNVGSGTLNLADDGSGFVQAIRTTHCDTQGNFRFDQVADGEFFVFSRITWYAGNALQGGSIMKPVKLENGSTAELVLAPPN